MLQLDRYFFHKQYKHQVGLFFIICHILTCSLAVFAQKIMIIHTINADNQVLFTGLSNCLVELIECNFSLSFGVALLALLNSIICYLGITTTDWAMAMMNTSKFAHTVFFREKLYLSDIIGSFFIVAFHLYNAYNPVRSTESTKTQQPYIILI